MDLGDGAEDVSLGAFEKAREAGLHSVEALHIRQMSDAARGGATGAYFIGVESTAHTCRSSFRSGFTEGSSQRRAPNSHVPAMLDTRKSA